MQIIWDKISEEKILKIWNDYINFCNENGINYQNFINEYEQKFINEKESLALKILKKFPLSTKAGLALMSLCECYPRITNIKLRQKLIKSTLKKLPGLLSASSNLLNLSLAQKTEESIAKEVINTLSSSFVVASELENLDVKKAVNESGGLSVDCLGESAQTKTEINEYIKRYKEAIEFCSSKNILNKSNYEKELTVSIKMSALSTDFSIFNGYKEVEDNLSLIFEGDNKLAVAIDAEESHRSDLQREIFGKILNKGYENLTFSIAQQAYLTNGLQKLCELLNDNAKHYFGVRIVKGAYYDQEIRESQKWRYEAPVWRNKELTDVSWALMSLTMGYSDKFTHFATHSPMSLAQIMFFKHVDKKLGEKIRNYLKNIFIKNGLIEEQSNIFKNDFLNGGGEIQYLFGMGGERQKLASKLLTESCQKFIGYRAYAPVGGQKELLPYLVRRLLENGVNNSVWQKKENNKIEQEMPEIKSLFEKFKEWFGKKGKTREKIIIKDSIDIIGCSENIEFKRASGQKWWEDFAIFWNDKTNEDLESMAKSCDTKIMSENIKNINIAKGCNWINLDKRVNALNGVYNKLIDKKQDIIATLILEAKKHPLDALGEWQEAVDFISFYLSVVSLQKKSNKSEFKFIEELNNVLGEKNWRYKVGVNSIICISPWNFPLAITLGQLGAALCSGVKNIYLKPSPKMNMIYNWIQYLFNDVDGFNFKIANGEVNDFANKLKEFDVVLFTGGTNSFKNIKKSIGSDFTKLIGETGGVNALIADGSMEPGAVADIIVKSAFFYSGQKCSSVRIAFIDSSIFDVVKEKIKNYDIKWGNKFNSFGRELIDNISKEMVSDYIKKLEEKNQKIYLNGEGVISVSNIEDVYWSECFAPVLQIVNVDVEENFEKIKEKIKNSKTALTFTLLTKDEEKIQNIVLSPVAGNQYVNRISTGAIVGAQPFGGFLESGTGPKIGTLSLVDALSVDVVSTVEMSLFGGTVGIFDGGNNEDLININEYWSEK